MPRNLQSGVRLSLALLLLTTAGCSGVENTVTELSDVCAQSNGDELTVTASFSADVCASCDTLESSSCSLSRDGETITVAGEAVIRTKQFDPFGGCDDCVVVSASCSLQLEPGSYTLVGASEALEVEHPLTEESCQF